MFRQILQIHCYMAANDAVSHIVCDIAAMLDAYKIDNRIMGISKAEQIILDKGKWVDIRTLAEVISHDTLVIYHYALPTPLSKAIAELNSPKVLLYHNVTPPVFFEKYNQHMHNFVAEGIREVISMAPHFTYAWGDSAYNCSQLHEAGYLRTAVANPPYDFNRFSKIQPSKKITKKHGAKSILFVGRISPNKRQEDIIKAFYYYQRINPNSELTLVGNFDVFESYKQELDQLSIKLNVPINITGSIPLDELVAYYRNADLFLCMSEHEGFCIPLIEAMYSGIPVVAFDSSAISETIGNAGIIFKQKHFPSVAHLMNCVLNDKSLQEKMKNEGFERAKYFSKEIASKRLIKLIEDYAVELAL